jgi:hypothetical protein
MLCSEHQYQKGYNFVSQREGKDAKSRHNPLSQAIIKFLKAQAFIRLSGYEASS